MRLFYKLLISFISMSMLVLLFGYILSDVSRRTLQNSSGEVMVVLANGLAEMLNQELINDLTVFEEYTRDLILIKGLSESNRTFEKLESAQSYIDVKDSEWTGAPPEGLTPFMKELMQNALSRELTEKVGFHNERHCCPYAEVFVTNRYGAVIAMTNRLSDYRQDDEEWWQEAREKGRYISDFVFDASADAFSIHAGIRIDDETGGFLGVVKVVLDMKHLAKAILDSRALAYAEGMHYKLLTRDGTVIFSIDEREHQGELSTMKYFDRIKGAKGYFVEEGDKQGEGAEIFSYSRLPDRGAFKGLGWIVVLESPTEAMFASASKIKWISILLVSIGGLFTVAASYFLSRIVSNPVEKLRSAALAFGEGNYDTRVDVRSTDEIGGLAATFNTMAEHLENAVLTRENELLYRKNMEKLLAQQANYDVLTGLPNRNLLTRRLTRAIEQKKHDKDYDFAVLFMDLDRFKIVNDSLGHTIGDQLLIEVGKRLETCIRPDDMAARLGGDEFAIFANKIKETRDVLLVAERIQSALEEEFDLQGHKVFSSASFGVTLSKAGYSIAEELIRDSDTAMYRAKTRGKGYCEIFDSEMHAEMKKRLQLETDLRRAVDNREFSVVYQPIVSLSNWEVTGAEALIRWKHTDHGYVSPSVFIPIAEENGLILSIGEWILKTACAQNQAWHESGYRHLQVNVNFSIRQFQNHDHMKTIKKALRETGMPAQFLNIEITESVIMDAESVEVLNGIHELGAQNSIDDFGTGYSSLSVLTRLPINALKIDKSFIQNLNVDPNSPEIIKAIIAMAHSLDLTVVAEGVETEEQLKFLRSNHCDKIQGYLVCRPVDEQRLMEFLEKGWSPPSDILK